MMGKGSICRNCFHSYVCEQFNEHRDSDWDNKKCHFFNDHFVDTENVVEVVRCKDCIYWDKRTVNNKGFIICAASGMEIHTEDFCSYGERRETNAE